jgi:hypothetical protein
MPLASAGESNVLASLLAARFVSLHTAAPGDTGASEVSGGAYARQGPVSFANAGTNPTVASNTAVIQYPTATANWGTITHFGIWSAVSGGTFLGWNTVTIPKAINIDDIARWEVGKLTVTTD